MTSTVKSTYMKRMLTLAMAVLCIALHPVSAQKSEANENDKFYKAREIIEAKGDLSKAAELLRDNIKEYPKHIQSYVLLASLERRYERYGDALRLLDSALKNNHKGSGLSEANLLWWKGSVYADMDESEKGIEVMNQAVKLAKKQKDPNMMDMLQLLAQLHYNLKQYDESDRIYSQMRTMDDTEQLPMIGLARNMIAREQYDDALAMLETCKKYDEDYDEIYRFQMQAYEGKKEYKKMIDAMVTLYEKSDDSDYLDSEKFLMDLKYSIAVLKEKIASWNDNVIWKIVLSSVYSDCYMHARAIPLLTDLIDEYGNHPEILKQRADSYTDLGMLEQALEDMSLAIENSKGEDVAYNHAKRSWIHRASGLYEEAIRDIDVYIDRFPTRAYGYSVRGSSKEHLGDYAGAINDYNEGLELDEEYSYLYLRRGKLYSQMERMEEAANDFVKLCQLDTIVDSGSNRHYGLLFQMKHDEAFEWIDKIIEKYPYDPVHVYDKACMYSLIGSGDKALECLEEALSKGYRRFTHIDNDSDMDFLRNERQEQYDALMSRYRQIHEQEIQSLVKSIEGSEHAGTTTEVAMTKKYGGTYEIPCQVNGLPLKMIFDTGASDVTISAVEASFMLKNGYLSEEDVKGRKNYMTADGDIHEGTVLRLKEVKLGDAVLRNIEASVVHSQRAPLLLGQSVLEKFGTITIDNVNSKLLIKQ